MFIFRCHEYICVCVLLLLLCDWRTHGWAKEIVRNNNSSSNNKRWRENYYEWMCRCHSRRLSIIAVASVLFGIFPSFLSSARKLVFLAFFILLFSSSCGSSDEAQLWKASFAEARVNDAASNDAASNDSFFDAAILFFYSKGTPKADDSVRDIKTLASTIVDIHGRFVDIYGWHTSIEDTGEASFHSTKFSLLQPLQSIQSVDSLITLNVLTTRSSPPHSIQNIR